MRSDDLHSTIHQKMLTCVYYFALKQAEDSSLIYINIKNTHSGFNMEQSDLEYAAYYSKMIILNYKKNVIFFGGY